MKHFVTPGGEKLIMLTEEEYEDLVDARDAAIAMREVEAGRMPTIPAADLDVFHASPVAYWRRRKGVTQTALAEAVGASQSYIAQIEVGQRIGDVRLHAAMAKVLGVRMENIVRDL